MSRKRQTGGASRPKKGLTKWFAEEWVDVKTGKPCGRKSAKKSKRPYPSCRPKAVAAKMTKSEKASSARRKTGPAKIKHAVTASGRRRKTSKKS
jgi:hypothetical protein